MTASGVDDQRRDQRHDSDRHPTRDAEVPARSDVPPVFSLRLSAVGILFGVLFFALSLLPSLLPRGAVFQGVVSGGTLALGYGIGTLVEWAWGYLSLPTPSPRSTVGRVLWTAAAAAVGLLTALMVWQRVGWQNDLRELFGMEPISPTSWGLIVAVTAVVAVLLIVLGRALRKLFRLFARVLGRFVPVRLARLVGGILFVVLLGFIVNGLLVEGFFSVANSAFSTVDTSTDEGVVRPTAAERSGSPDSLVGWNTMGRQGRNFAATGPTVDDLNAFHGGGARTPIRVYAGLKSAATLEGRAELVLEELQRTGAFEREILVVATTTGTGYLEPNAMNSLEYIHNGDTAVAGVQYSYLPSWISLLADQETTKETSQVVFRKVHEYWSALPEDARPNIYLYGLSLGSFGVESILGSINVLNEPVDGALMTGPPFVNDLWNDIVDNRDEGSPPWRPVYQDGRTVRFTNLEYALDQPDGEWGDTRVIYLQHASDPVTFFSPDLVLTRPDWLRDGQRGPDVSPEMAYVPFVTAWQVALDLPAAGGVPEGYGHLFSADENLSSWVALTRPEGWTEEDSDRLRATFAELEAQEEE